ncbi:MAG: hypothetical protein ABWZ88_22805 [Variovorax sp.]
MSFTLRLLPLLLICVGPALAAPDSAGKSAEVKGGAAQQQRSELREAVESHRSAKRDEVQRDEAAAGRRLTAAERAELREQLRRQWVASSATLHPPEAVQAETQPPERLSPMPIADAAPSRNLVPVARSQRP